MVEWVVARTTPLTPKFRLDERRGNAKIDSIGVRFPVLALYKNVFASLLNHKNEFFCFSPSQLKASSQFVLPAASKQRGWFNGRIDRCHKWPLRSGRGSIPRPRKQ
jgi:hypothetical protein